MDKSFRLSRRPAESARGSKSKISGLVLKKKFVLYLTKIILFVVVFYFSLLCSHLNVLTFFSPV